ncbi:MAG: intradiol ring-cleavage dioxygenase [Planctomycetota bacterium]|nr:MAG: intradiol ring-cleavage dioxygenase [Planctomycetota bacterium]
MAVYASLSRRHFVRTMALGATALAAPVAWAERLTPTPAQTEGPFYPDRLPLDTDNDLLIIGDSRALAVGEVTHLGGRILDADGAPLRNALVEIWQVDANGVYLHSRSAGEKRDAHFQGYGRFTTSSTGEYYFRTVKPVPYPGRTPHIHVMVSRHGRPLLTTQLYVRGEPQNDRDGLFRSIRDQRQRDAVLVDFKPLPESALGELTARFDVVLGLTPEEQ